MNFPGTHATQTVLLEAPSAVDAVPVEHSVQAPAVRRAVYDPAWHCEHTVLPCALAYIPPPQVLHPTASPVEDMYIPSEQRVHLVAPVPAM
jgi:hypothetical protein